MVWLGEDPSQVHRGEVTSANQAFNVVIMTTLVGLAVVAMAYAARRTIKAALGEQLARSRLQHAQVELVLREKVATIAHLVSGISHELNSPLGALESAISTQRSALAKLASHLEPGKKSERLLRLLEETARVQAEASGRIAKTGRSIRSFAHLDEGRRQRFDLGRELELVLSRIPPELVGKAETETDLPDDVMLEGDPFALGQAFQTVLLNAFEALSGNGLVQVKLQRTAHRARVDITDDGPGIHPDVLDRLFEVTLEEQGHRVVAGFGLPAAQSVVFRHGGTIDVRTELGAGTTVTIELPLGQRQERDVTRPVVG